MSGGTGVFQKVYSNHLVFIEQELLFLIIGSAIGGYFVITDGIIIAIILGFAILSIYFYSTKIVDSGLGEFFVAVKGSMIVLVLFSFNLGKLLLNPFLQVWLSVHYLLLFCSLHHFLIMMQINPKEERH